MGDDMRLAEWFVDGGVVREMRGSYLGSWPVRHVVVDGVLEGELGDVDVQGVLRALTSGDALRAVGRVGDVDRLVHVPKRVVHEVGETGMLTNMVERFGSLWRRVVMRLVLGGDGEFEFWRDGVLQYGVRGVPGRMVLGEVEPGVYWGVSGVGMRWMEVQYYGLEMPAWGPKCQCELRRERP